MSENKFYAEILDLDINDTKEAIYAGSGSSPNPGQPETPPAYEDQKCWINWKFTWTGHNNGGHSVCHVYAEHNGNHSGESLVIFIKTNFDIVEVKNASGCIITNYNSRLFSLTRNGHFNANDNIGFNFEIVTSTPTYDAAGNPLHGAIGADNATKYYCELECYFCS